MDNYCILTFYNTHGAIGTEEVLKNRKIGNSIMPTPTGITKSCGLSIRVSFVDIESIKMLVKSEKIKIKDIYLKHGDKYEKIDLE